MSARSKDRDNDTGMRDETKRKNGRPRFPEGLSRSAQVLVRLRPAECEHVKLAAKAAGKSISEYIRVRILARDP
jgi:hypothetical protein